MTFIWKSIFIHPFVKKEQKTIKKKNAIDILLDLFYLFLQETIHSKVLMMGGEISRNLTEHVTHLVAGTVGSSKYQVRTDQYHLTD